MPLSQVNPENYQLQLNTKRKHIAALFSEFDLPTIEVMPSPPLHFRVRAEFRIWHDAQDSYYVMFKKDNPKTPHRVDQFPIGAVLINQLMPLLMDHIKTSEILKRKLFQIEFLTTLSDQVLVSMIYHKALNAEWETLARELQKKLNIQIIGRSKKQRLVLENDYVTETLHVNAQPYHFQQIENSFTQPNATVNQKMLTWAQTHSQHNGGDLLELYCGNGNFTIILAQNFNKVLATEISKPSVKSARHNFAINNTNNVEVARMSSEELTAALQGTRTFRRLENIDLNSYQFSTVFVDPPRAGLDSATEELISRFNNIIYISCNPTTLHHNLQSICKTHKINHFALFDQFPYTDHVECGVALSKK